MMVKHLLPVLWLLIFLAGGSAVNAQTFPIPLDHGPYGVGFKSYWKSDSSRTYYPSAMSPPSAGENPFPRPILINIWYPAVNGKRTMMGYGQYLLPPAGKSLAPHHLSLYREYNRQISIAELSGNSEDKLNANDKIWLGRILGTRTNAARGATAARGKFPLLIYHQGNRASLDDNILLCEYLASHGYVVVNSSFLDAAGTTWGVDAAMGSVSDISFILSNIARWESNVDIKRAGIIGHSAGAQAAHIAMAQGTLALKVMVSLETTEEYFTLADQRWKKFLDPTLLGVDKVKGDLLLIAKPGAIFQLADKMKNARRYYFTIPNVRHNDFISQGIFHKYVDSLREADEKSRREFERVSSDYVSICKLILRFVDVRFKSKNSLVQVEPQTAQCNGWTRCVEEMAEGSTISRPYQIVEAEAPTVRQFRQLVADSPDEAVAVLQRFKSDPGKVVMYDSQYSFAIIDELMETGRRDTARRLYQTYVEVLGKQYVSDFKFNCDFFGMFNKEIEGRCREKLEFLTK